MKNLVLHPSVTILINMSNICGFVQSVIIRRAGFYCKENIIALIVKD